jgi:hypothetical protein
MATTNLPDHDAHLCAIRSLALNLKDWNAAFENEANVASRRSNLSEAEVQDVISIFYDSGFSDLARSHAFICSITAFLESLFVLCLPQVGVIFKGQLDPNHARVQRYNCHPASFWDPRKITADRDGIVARIDDILTASGLFSSFPSDATHLMNAAFGYRNEMVHNGYEWPLDNRIKFQLRVSSESWSDWFTNATTGSDPWFFTVTELFHDQCLILCDQTVSAFEQLLYQAP